MAISAKLHPFLSLHSFYSMMKSLKYCLFCLQSILWSIVYTLIVFQWNERLIVYKEAEKQTFNNTFFSFTHYFFLSLSLLQVLNLSAINRDRGVDDLSRTTTYDYSFVIERHVKKRGAKSTKRRKENLFSRKKEKGNGCRKNEKTCNEKERKSFFFSRE